MRLALSINENESLKTEVKSKKVGFDLFPENNEQLAIISRFAELFDVNADLFEVTLPEDTQDVNLENFTTNIGKSSNEVLHCFI